MIPQLKEGVLVMGFRLNNPIGSSIEGKKKGFFCCHLAMPMLNYMQFPENKWVREIS